LGGLSLVGEVVAQECLGESLEVDSQLIEGADGADEVGFAHEFVERRVEPVGSLSSQSLRKARISPSSRASVASRLTCMGVNLQ
jgi:hypothetical protein